MRTVCEQLFQRYLRPIPNRPGCYIQVGQTQVMVESAQWKLAYSPLEKVVYDLSSEHGLLLEVPGDRGTHLVNWNRVVRITVHEGGGHF